MGDRNERANGQWLLDLYFLQYGAYVLFSDPTDKRGLNISCKVDWSRNYASVIAQLGTARLVFRNASISRDLYVGTFTKQGASEAAEIWTNDRDMPYRVSLKGRNTEVEYVYESNMKNEVPQFDDDILSSIRTGCDSGNLEDIVDEKIAEFIIKANVAA